MSDESTRPLILQGVPVGTPLLLIRAKVFATLEPGATHFRALRVHCCAAGVLIAGETVLVSDPHAAIKYSSDTLRKNFSFLVRRENPELGAPFGSLDKDKFDNLCFANTATLLAAMQPVESDCITYIFSVAFSRDVLNANRVGLDAWDMSKALSAVTSTTYDTLKFSEMFGPDPK